MGSIATAVLIVLGLAVGACGDDEDGDADTSNDDGAETTEADPADDAAGEEGGSSPCAAVDTAAVEDELDDTIGEGTGGTTMVTERDVTWVASQCEWESAGGIELQLRMVDIADLPDECPALESPVYEISELSDLGDAAWWEWDSLEGEGAVRVCTSRGMAESRVESPDGEPLDEDFVMAVALAAVTSAVDAL